jgi:uncharacterized protein (TIGR02145 family)
MKIFTRLAISVILITVLNSSSQAQEIYTDQRDGNAYRTISINGVTWLAENLRYNTKTDGALSFDKNPHNVPVLGVLYDWKTAASVCPVGWHLPSGSEFRKLVDHFETAEQWEGHGSGPNTFRIQLAGMQDYEGTFSELGESAYYWTSTEYTNEEAEFFSYLIVNGKALIDISRRGDLPDIHGAEKENKYSVRCVRN